MEEKIETFNRNEERELIHKLDKRLLLFAMFGNLVKALDNSNLASAYISGMEEELHVKGLEYNWMGILFMLGYLSMQLPSNILLSNMRPSKYLPTLELIWCLLTIAMSCVQSVQNVYFIRFLLGLAEAGFYPGIVFLVGTWYTKKELGKRLALLTICGSFGSGLSGVVQAIMLKTMDGIFGISGWRWMFLFDASITLVLAYFGYKYLPDYPHNTDWLTEREKWVASQRVQQQQQQNDSHLSSQLTKMEKPDTIVTMIAGLCNGFISDRHRTRLWCIIVPAFFGLIGISMLSAFVQPFPLLYFAFLLTHAGLGSLSSVVMTWATEIISPNMQIRAMAIAIMNTSSSLTWTWTSLLLWPVTDAPYYHKGFTVGAVLVVLFILSMVSIYYMQNHSVKKPNSEGFLPLPTEEEIEEK
ncbi:hypothetical protein G6F34_004813 [Rhizopus arrhizus]|nr:hypothetical protein G6F34_004813 [Rhizopus arrhizus]